MNISNLNRDFVHLVDLNFADLEYPTEAAMGKTCPVQNDTFVRADVSFARGGKVRGAVTAGSWTAIGALIEQPRDDATPYRIQAWCANEFAHLIIGYAPEAPSGLADVVSGVVSIPFRNEIDICALVPVLDKGNADYPKPLCVGVAVGEIVAGATRECLVSVQKLSKAPPRYASVVS